MDDSSDFPDDSLRHVQALLSRHPPHVIQRMFQHVLESRTLPTGYAPWASVASDYTSSNSSIMSRYSMMSTSSAFSTSTGSTDVAPSSASSISSSSRMRRQEPRSYPFAFMSAKAKPSLLTPSSETSSPLDLKQEHTFTPTEEEGNSLASPVTHQNDKSQSQPGESFMFCTYCAEINILKTFKAKSDWKKHEMRMHETGEDWPCPVIGCGRVHDRQKDFVKHHSRYHSGRPLPSVTDIGIRLLPRRVFGCGFDRCKDVSIGWDERCDHVAKHMKNGYVFEQWKYSNVIRNLIRQEALHDTWKELFASLDERLKESRSHITWSPHNTRVLRQKLQCCDLRPSREEVLITALSLRSDLPLDPSQIHIPPGFVTPSRDSVPNMDQLTREQRMHVLIGTPNLSLSRTRLAALNAALLQRSFARTSQESYMESPVVEESDRRISYMDVDSGDYLDLADAAIPPLPPSMETLPSMNGEQPQVGSFTEEPKPANPLSLCYPSYFDAAPTFEESDYYDRKSLGRIISKPLQKIGSKLRTSSPHSRPSSQTSHHELMPDYTTQPVVSHEFHQINHSPIPQHSHPIHYSQQPLPPQPTHPQQAVMRQQFRGPDPLTPLHIFTPQI
ncbi:hypothetical protein M011DRAFT_445565 [Sporormia fimetaria CBS 119925]|uniref:C2H2-type domain-containing protein n=1 Tax=Sporormia fimetaria CBS 119925 TaxID=1340428 RepID=A0A6A6V9J7_9PLEO|nr:hypothetical protein M011DRAFT_445565 [Sporormia fimetaria CBS 119925]